VCRRNCDELWLVNIFSVNKVAILYSVDLLCVLNCVFTETIQVMERGMLVSPAILGRMLVSPAIERGMLVSPAIERGMLVSPAIEGGRLVSPAIEGGRLVSPAIEGGMLVSPAFFEEQYKVLEPSLNYN
jgi:hypothetical protein